MNGTVSNVCPRKKILLVDSHSVLRNAVSQFINTTPDLVVCGEAENKQQALKAVEAFKPDLVLADLFLGEQSTLGLIREIAGRSPNLPILVFSMHDEQVYRNIVREAGAWDYLLKVEPPVQMLEHIRQALRKNTDSPDSASGIPLHTKPRDPCAQNEPTISARPKTREFRPTTGPL